MSCPCPYAGQLTGEAAPCSLQRLAQHTITVTNARAPRVAAFVLLVDLAEPTHTAVASNLSPALAARLLEVYARTLRGA